jgi:hypothetical protein
MSVGYIDCRQRASRGVLTGSDRKSDCSRLVTVLSKAAASALTLDSSVRFPALMVPNACGSSDGFWGLALPCVGNYLRICFPF